MNELRKSIQNLTIQLDDKRKELSDTNYKFGEKLLSDAVDPLVLSGAVSQERIDSWQIVRNQREANTKNLLDIKTALNRQQELERFRKELSALLEKENVDLNGNLSVLGKLLSDIKADQNEPELQEFFAQISPEKNELEKLEQKQDKLRTDLATANFFNKMFAQLKIAGITSSIRQVRSRLDKKLAIETGKLVEKGFTDTNFFGLDSSSIMDQITKVTVIKERIKGLEERDQNLKEELSAELERLSDLGVSSSNPNARLAELRSLIKDNDKKIDLIVALSAREYTDKFLDENGRSLLGNTGDGHTFSDMGMYAHQLEFIALLRSEIFKISRNIEILETELKIENLDKSISSYKKAKTDCQQKIQQLTTQIASLDAKVLEAEAEKARLLDYKETIGHFEKLG